MSEMADPIVILNRFQEVLDQGMPLDSDELEENYKFYYDEPENGRRFSFVKVINREAQSLVIFGLEDPIEGLTCYNVGYAVKESFRGRGFAIEAINHGLKKLIKQLSDEGIKKFYLEALIDKNNINSISVAKRFFSDEPVLTIDRESGTISLQFKKIVYT